MKNFVALVIFWLLFQCLFVQEVLAANSVDSLLRSWKGLTVQQKADSLIELHYKVNRTDLDKAASYARKALSLGQKVNDKVLTEKALKSIGSVYYRQGAYAEALTYYLEGLQIVDSLNREVRIADYSISIGNVYLRLQEFNNARSYYQKALRTYKKIKDREGIGLAFDGIASTYIYQGAYDKSLNFYQKALKVNEERGDQAEIARISSNMAQVHIELEYYNRALELLFKSLEAKQLASDKSGIAGNYTSIADVYHLQGSYDKANQYYQKALKLARSYGDKNLVKIIYDELSKMYREKGDYQQALQYKDRFIAIKDSLLDEKKSGQIAELQTKYKTKKKEARLAKQQTELKRQNFRQNMLIGGVGFLVILVLLVLRNYYIKRKANKQLSHQKAVIEEKNRSITASIGYAKRIQEALLKEKEHVTPHLPSHFVLFKPKDPVSGDFYWSVVKDEYWYTAVADCTGHGVPGALLTMLGTAFLNELTSVEGQVPPNKLLDQLRERFVKELGEEETASEASMRMRDGMDISLLRLNLNTKKAVWAGANNPLYVVAGSEFRVSGSKVNTFLPPTRNAKPQTQNPKLYELLPDKQPIGYTEDAQPFTAHHLDLQKGDALYLFSDGYADQFGGPKGKKFMYNRFKQLLLSVQDESPDKQRATLNQTIEDWMAESSEEQIDDICITGVKMD